MGNIPFSHVLHSANDEEDILAKQRARQNAWWLVLGKSHIPHCPSNRFDRTSYIYLGLSPISLSFWVGTLS